MSTPKSDVILYTVYDQGIAVLQVNRPQARNALNWAARERFAEVVEGVAMDNHVRALIITGSGNRAFVSGGDLKELHEHPEREAGERLNRVMSGALARLRQLPVPVIAAVNGDAFGGGCEIVAACDLRLSSPHARFSFAQVPNGLITGWGGTGFLVYLIGQSRALDLLLTARMFAAEEAQHMGFIQRIAAEGENVLAAARDWAAELVTLPKEALAATKRLVYAAGHLSAAEIAKMEAELFVGLWETSDHLEALQAFAEKRPPRFNQEWPGNPGRK
jgi:enoyl-CoA hydratase